ncbi:MAG TPA: 3-phosphoshikimate 1-carboxyvinyltransferase [Anaerolineaceae bacterium]|nr:3-phosphoshikimate 1-carboxyvinyltransferase [Anaerolineaceae bacterium]HPN52633.1 3-phosphoshikimate 1-carboxyvinyltransferase [Anaerolineaceae bacterium]
MNLILTASPPLHGDITLPGDKSLSHRAALFAALAEGESQVEQFLDSGVTRAMLNALSALGISWSLKDGRLSVTGRGLRGLRAPLEPVDCGNSATTLRLLAGALSASGAAAVLSGSASLCARPMQRIVDPLWQMGADITAQANGCAPLQLSSRPASRPLFGQSLDLPVASAQVKSCLLLAGLAADGPTCLSEPALSRDHTERMLAGQGVIIQSRQSADGRAHVTLQPPENGALRPLQMRIPGDFSAAAFLIVAALIIPGSEITLRGVGLNPTRTGLLDTLREMGGDICVQNLHQPSGEPAGDLVIRASRLHAVTVSGERVVQMIDEFPAFGAAAAFAEGTTLVSQAEELRYKESDRITALCQELRRQGVAAEEKPDGFLIAGQRQVPGGAVVDPRRDHRLAMALAVLGLAAKQPVTIQNAEIMAESFPAFVPTLQALGALPELEGIRHD